MKTDRYGGDITWLPAQEEQSYFHILNYAAETRDSGTRDGMHLNGPYPLHLFGQMLTRIDRYQDELELSGAKYLPTFRVLDAGCGAGQLVALASEVFCYTADGFDLDEKYVKQARVLFKELGISDAYAGAWVQDATEFEHYGDYDIVVLNKLFVGPVAQSKLEAKVHDELKSGAYMIRLNNITLPEGWEMIFSDGLGGSVIRKPM